MDDTFREQLQQHLRVLLKEARRIEEILNGAQPVCYDIHDITRTDTGSVLKVATVKPSLPEQ